MAEWFEDESFWRDLRPHLFGDDVFSKAEEEVERALALAGVGSGSALDLCCGLGRHSIALASRGFQVTAVDRTRFLLDEAQRRASSANLFVDFVLEDMRSFVRASTFDLVLNLFTSFGYFDDRAEDLAVLQNIHRSLKPRGCLVIDVASKERLAKTFQPTVSSKAPDGSLLVRRHEIADDWTRVKNEWTLVRDGRVRSWTFHVRVYSGEELKDLLLGAGFIDVTLFGDLDGRPYGLDVNRLVAVARKE